MWRRMTKLIVIILVVLSPAVVVSLQFELGSGTVKCIAENINHDTLSVGKYAILKHNQTNGTADGNRMSVWLTSPLGLNYHSTIRAETGAFAFTTKEAGDYVLCFWASNHNPAKILSIELEWRSGLLAKEWPNIAKKSQLQEIEVELKKLLDKASSISEETSYLHQREEEMEELNSSINGYMVRFVFVSIVICSSVAAVQLRYLKAFFERKKLI